MYLRPEHLKRLATLIALHAAIVAPAVVFAHAAPVADTAAQEWVAGSTPCSEAGRAAHS
jgi:hypothetical protein